MALGRQGARGGFGRGGALGGASIPPWVVNPANAPDIAIDWANNRAWKKAGGLFTPSSLITVSRASSKTDLFPTSASGFAYSTFLSNVPAITPLGLLQETGRTNVLLNSTAPVTQTTASLATGTYTLWVNGSGSAASSAGSATITGAGAATNGTPNIFVVTVAGTVTITVSGSLNAFQCELGAAGTSLIVTAGVTAARAADVIPLTTSPFSSTATGTVYSQYGAAVAGLAFRQPWMVDDGTAANSILLDQTNSTTVRTESVSASSTTNRASATITAGANNKVAAAWASGDWATVANGGAAGTNAVAGLPTINSPVFRFGSLSGGSNIDNFHLYTAIWATQRVPNAQLQSIMS